jgi:hypothetical protein
MWLAIQSVMGSITVMGGVVRIKSTEPYAIRFREREWAVGSSFVFPRKPVRRTIKYFLDFVWFQTPATRLTLKILPSCDRYSWTQNKRSTTALACDWGALGNECRHYHRAKRVANGQ